jgi:pimeloyl-ACP methyl ester carboxylesterase
MAYFESSGTRIYYEEHGNGAPVLLIHGFGVNAYLQWGKTGLIDHLARCFRVIALDCRGHGQSDAPHDPAAYAVDSMAADAVGLLDRLRIGRTLLVGFSLGSRICFEIMRINPERCRAAVLAGWGPDNARSGDPQKREKLVAALHAADERSIAGEYERRIRRAVLDAGNDPLALAACIMNMADMPAPADVGQIGVPVLFSKGGKDVIAGDPAGLSVYFRESRVLVFDGNGHASVVADPRFHAATSDFLAAAPQ